MRAKELRELTVEELEHELREATQSIFNLRVQTASGQQLDNVKRFRELRRDIARMKTVLGEKKRIQPEG
ncbi:MAG: 50S ribosomal protein L29 [Candidatus Abyssobacteria bacterium SURF_17]|jgi:large subunit ribosomal protein L29|uniref:Large ribosomal subunit protein uL29 n=1 Tax=Candidatus Abyssobacteria bacterium SURF_17 TaxID=2093361 RepID=A0A419EVJ3_9BACT|nr:MAG: 50S ribosomal protein L29 [Candidatus Abyssubacteria bacterium SURF_17]